MNIGSVIPQGGGNEQELSPQIFVLYNTDRSCKSGLIVVTAIANGYATTWTIIIYFEAPFGCARHRSLEGCQPHAEALKSQDSGPFTGFWQQERVLRRQNYHKSRTDVLRLE